MINLKKLSANRPLIIILHILGWACFLFFPFFIYRIQILHKAFFIKELIDNLFLIGIFYLNIYVLIPRFFTGKKIVLYIISILALVVFITMQQALLDYYFFKNYLPARTVSFTNGKKMGFPEVTERGGRPFTGYKRWRHFEAADDVSAAGVNVVYTNTNTVSAMQPVIPAIPTIPFPYRQREGGDSLLEGRVIPRLAPGPAMMAMGEASYWRYLLFPEVLRRSGFFALLMLFMSGFIKIAFEWFKSEKQREVLNVEKLNAELKFLKSQINPHFLFNCLNTIYSLAHKNSDETERAILKLSTIMRYMIYESNEENVQLQQEIDYLRDYIDIQRLRLSDNISIDCEVTGEAAGLSIEPMLLIPFVENAFKHGISYSEHSFIAIKVMIENNMIRLTVRNSLFKQRVSERGGIGLQNVLKRLDLLYDQRHDINITELENEFIVDLKIVLKK
jgi:two-component system LytT family sensor kinase